MKLYRFQSAQLPEQSVWLCLECSEECIIEEPDEVTETRNVTINDALRCGFCGLPDEDLQLMEDEEDIESCANLALQEFGAVVEFGGHRGTTGIFYLSTVERCRKSLLAVLKASSKLDLLIDAVEVLKHQRCGNCERKNRCEENEKPSCKLKVLGQNLTKTLLRNI